MRLSRKARVIISAVSRFAPGEVTSQRSPSRPSWVSNACRASRRSLARGPGSITNSIRSSRPVLPLIACSCGRSSRISEAGARGASLAEGMTPAIGRTRGVSLTTSSSVAAGPSSVASSPLTQSCGPARKRSQNSRVGSGARPVLAAPAVRCAKTLSPVACWRARLESAIRSTPSNVNVVRLEPAPSDSPGGRGRAAVVSTTGSMWTGFVRSAARSSGRTLSGSVPAAGWMIQSLRPVSVSVKWLKLATAAWLARRTAT